MTSTCGRSPSTTGRSLESIQARQAPRSASARRCGGVRNFEATMCVRVGVHHGAQRGEEHLPGLGVEVAVHPDHAAEGGGHVEAAPPEAFVLTACASARS